MPRVLRDGQWCLESRDQSDHRGGTVGTASATHDERSAIGVRIDATTKVVKKSDANSPAKLVRQPM